MPAATAATWRPRMRCHPKTMNRYTGHRMAILVLFTTSLLCASCASHDYHVPEILATRDSDTKPWSEPLVGLTFFGTTSHKYAFWNPDPERIEVMNPYTYAPYGSKAATADVAAKKSLYQIASVS